METHSSGNQLHNEENNVPGDTNSFYSQVAALSPAAMNYEETLSTLRYADR